MKLTTKIIEKSTAQAKSYRLTDGKGMYLLVTKSGSKLWRLDYTLNKKRNTHALGIFPDITLHEARNLRFEAKKLISEGIDPNQYRKLNFDNLEKTTFEAIALQWHTKFSTKWSDSHKQRIFRRLEKDVFPWIGARQIKEITSGQLLSVLERVADRGALETAHRIHQNCGAIFRYAIATDRATHDITLALKGAIPPVKVKHHASITDPKEISALLNVIDGYQGEFTTRCALQLSPLLFLRPGELRHAEWSELNLTGKEWRIPANKMKMNITHIIPLSTQAITIIKELQALTGNEKYLFPSLRSKTRPMSENTINAALKRLGYTKDDMTGHGFRSMASTLLNEMNYNTDAIERQLAHSEANKVKAAYNYAEHLGIRREMMQEWSDFLYKLKQDKNTLVLSNI